MFIIILHCPCLQVVCCQHLKLTNYLIFYKVLSILQFGQNFLEHNMSKYTTSILKQLDPNLLTKDTSQSDQKWISKSQMPKIKAQFKGIQIKILNMFTSAKSQLSTNYQKIVAKVKKIQKYLFTQNSRVMPSFCNLMQDIEQQLEEKIQQMSQNIDKIVIQSFTFDHLLSLLPDATNTQNFICSQKKINNSVISSTNRFTQKAINQTIADIDSITAFQYKTAVKIKPFEKRLENLGVLSGKWDVLQLINLENKAISTMVPMVTVIAQTLQQINLSYNQIHKIDFLRDADYPILRILNLQKNYISHLEGIQCSKLPNLKYLNLSENKIKRLEGLEEAHFPELIELNLSKNKIQKGDKLIQCDFPKLQVLNLDNNIIQSLDFIQSSTFYRLKILSFCYNEIKNIDFLKKCRFQKLQAILGYNNKIQSIEFLQHSDFPQLKQIILNNNLISDINVIQKMNFKHLAEFDLQNNSIKPQEIFCFVTKSDQYKKARKKFPFIQL